MMNPIFQLANYGKAITLLLLTFSLLGLSQTAHSAISDSYQVERFTDTGLKDNTGVAIVRWEQGTLFVTQGFQAITSAEYSATIFKIDPATLAAINGKFVSVLATWTGLSNIKGYLHPAFQRSTETYSIDGVPNVIVSLAGGSNGQNNTPGTICSSTVTTITPGNATVTVSATQPNAAEQGPINGRFQIDLDAPRAKNTVVAFNLGGTASKGKDYKPVKASVMIPAGTTSAYVDIAPINDKKKEGTETVVLTLKASGAYTVGNASSATVNIADND